jgi:hypothetical protein
MSSLRRRWLLTCVLLLLTLAASAGIWKKLPPTYQSVSSIVFLVPESTAKAFGGNPYLAFNGTLNQTADVVRYETNDVRTANSLKAQGYPSSYLVTDAADTSGPVLIVTVTGSSETGVEHTLYGVTSEVSTKLETLQTGLAADNEITDKVITFMPEPSYLKSKKEKPTLLLLALGLVLTVSIPVVVDAQRARRGASQAAGNHGEYAGSAGRAAAPAAYPVRGLAEPQPRRSSHRADLLPPTPPLRRDPGEPVARQTDGAGGADPRPASRQPMDATRRSGLPAGPAGNRTR